MSPRAAARLETLGFDKVYDYVSGSRTGSQPDSRPYANRVACLPLAIRCGPAISSATRVNGLVMWHGGLVLMERTKSLSWTIGTSCWDGYGVRPSMGTQTR